MDEIVHRLKKEETEIRRVIDAHSVELFAVTSRYNQEIADIHEFVKMKLERVEKLIELLKEQERVLRFYNGLPVEPVAHAAEAVLLPAGGFGAA